MIVHRYGALIREEQLYLRPWNAVVTGKFLVNRAGTLPSGKRDGNQAIVLRGRPDGPGNVVGSGTSENLGRNDD